MKKYGFYCRMYGKDCFIETEQTKRTNKIALEFINKVQNYMNVYYNINSNDVEHVKNTMRLSSFKLKTIENGSFKGLKYYEINGENFSYGCDACENPMEECIAIIKEG